MRILIGKDYAEMSKKAALMVAAQIVLKPNSVLGLATGSTPIGLYQELGAMYQRGELDFSAVKTFNLDEYYPIAPDHPQSYQYFMYNYLFSKINIKQENIHLLKGNTDRVTAECAAYERMIAEVGGIDFQVLGIGINGHIGFNEPRSYVHARTHLVDLLEDTIQANSRFFTLSNEVPRQAVTMGMGTILKARRILLIANGRHKAEAIKKTVKELVTTECPSSFLQTHPAVTLILDQEAAALL
jgi:glucosamine-6-phosphate deaminase